MYMLKDETLFESDLFLPRGLIAITPPPYRNTFAECKIKPQTAGGPEVKTNSQSPQFLNDLLYSKVAEGQEFTQKPYSV
jgi:hypothetical protein